MNNHVPDIERCKRLREMGFPQHTEFAWSVDLGAYKIYRCYCKNLELPSDSYAAPIVTELLAEIRKAVPSTSRTWMEISVIEDGVFVNLIDHEDAETYADTMPNALADLWMWLKERRYDPS